jgi:hypothetical protein
MLQYLSEGVLDLPHKCIVNFVLNICLTIWTSNSTQDVFNWSGIVLFTVIPVQNQEVGAFFPMSDVLMRFKKISYYSTDIFGHY